MTSPTRLQALRAALARLREEDRPPKHLVDAAIALHRRPIVTDVFRLRAAASGEPQDLLCRSQSGLFTIQTFTPRNDEGESALGQILLTVDPEHRAAYEGRVVRISVRTEEGERVIAEAEVHDGELLADFDRAGLDLTRRDAINVTFDMPEPK